MKLDQLLRSKPDYSKYEQYDKKDMGLPSLDINEISKSNWFIHHKSKKKLNLLQVDIDLSHAYSLYITIPESLQIQNMNQHQIVNGQQFVQWLNKFLHEEKVELTKTAYQAAYIKIKEN